MSFKDFMKIMGDILGEWEKVINIRTHYGVLPCFRFYFHLQQKLFQMQMAKIPDNEELGEKLIDIL